MKDDDSQTPREPVMERPVLTFPDEVSDWVRSHYEKAGVILEYGSGGSTVLASEMPGKRVFSVESDRAWMDNLQRYLDSVECRSPVTLHHADIGPTGKWGRPTDDSGWRGYHRYPLSVWDREDFVQPDLILIDGRFRAACLITALLRVEKETTVLFDDYKERRRYHAVEEFAKPVEFVDRMARFVIEPTALPRAALTRIVGMFTQPF